MKIVIDIPDEDIDAIKYLQKNGFASRHELAILNGIPLPKGHGRLIDADALEVSMADDWHTANEIANCIKYAPTIIEADNKQDFEWGGEGD